MRLQNVKTQEIIDVPEAHYEMALKRGGNYIPVTDDANVPTTDKPSVKKAARKRGRKRINK